MPLARMIASTREVAGLDASSWRRKAVKKRKEGEILAPMGDFLPLYCFNTRGERSRTVTSSSVIECSVKKNCDGALGLGRAAIGVVMGPG
jgi:hypothetical protein